MDYWASTLSADCSRVRGAYLAMLLILRQTQSSKTTVEGDQSIQVHRETTALIIYLVNHP